MRNKYALLCASTFYILARFDEFQSEGRLGNNLDLSRLEFGHFGPGRFVNVFIFSEGCISGFSLYKWICVVPI